VQAQSPLANISILLADSVMNPEEVYCGCQAASKSMLSSSTTLTSVLLW